ncbi:MAG: DUF1579 family protein [Candidatus Kapabacteria bacterium]|nr:DUF1579 family protein [Candidatus Kapabacteria bacterium]
MKRIFNFLLVIVISISALFLTVHAQKKTNQSPETLIERSDEYEPLTLFLGNWRLLFVSYDKQKFSNQGTGFEEIKFITGDRFLSIENTIVIKGFEMKRHGYISYNKILEKFTYYFIDDNASFPVQLEGDYNSTERTFTFYGNGFDYALFKERKLKVYFKFESEDRYVEKRYWIDDKGKETIMIEFTHIKN